MHGLINRSLQYFIIDTAGEDVWQEVVKAADLEFDSFEAMLTYDPEVTFSVIAAGARILGKPNEVFLEDLGTYLVSHPSIEALRRLLRFGGLNYVEFLRSLDELPDRARLAVSDLDLPELELRETDPTCFVLLCRSAHPGFGSVLLGVLRTMADDYGALALLDVKEISGGQTEISIDLIETGFAEGRHFDLSSKHSATAS